MKKLQYLPMCFLLIATMFATSCTKESAILNSGYTPSPVDQLPAGSEIGSMVDLGLINSDTRVMVTTLNTQSFTLDGAGDVVSGTSAMVRITMYVSEDAQIPSGEYFFSNSDSKLPFTFDSAVFSGGLDSNGYPTLTENIVEGSVIVTQVGSGYHFEFQGHLESGRLFSGSTDGLVTYTDNNIY